MREDPLRVKEAIHRAKRKYAAVRREMELFGMMLFGVLFGILSSMAASFADNVVRGSITDPHWYGYTVFTAFFLTLIVLGTIYVSLLKERREIEQMEHRFEEVLTEAEEREN